MMAKPYVYGRQLDARDYIRDEMPDNEIALLQAILLELRVINLYMKDKE